MRKYILLLSLFFFGKTESQVQTIYREQYRPQFHFTPIKNWMNDPNGLVYQDGLYHLFFQHNPFGNEWGHMSWGHATSKDLVHWNELPVAIAEENGIMIFSGSVVDDKNNTTGLAKDQKATTLVAIYTGHTDTLQTQQLAFSRDGGMSWHKYAANPVLNLHKKDFRDPNVFWYEPKKEWIMAVSQPNEHQISFYASSNLKQWDHLSDFGPRGDISGVWECPDLMQAPIVGEPGKYKWVLFTSQNSTMQYFVGEFDGTQFLEDKPSSTIHKQDHGTDYYAAVAYHNTNDKQPISIGWVNNWEYANTIPTKPWKSAMSLPRKLSVKKQGDDWVLVQQPILGLQILRGTEQHAKELSIQQNKDLSFSGTSYELSLSIQPSENAIAGIRVAVGGNRYFEISYDSKKELLSIDRSHTVKGFNAKYASIAKSGTLLKTKDGKIDLRIFFDASIVEIYSGDGTVVFTSQVFPEKTDTGIQLFSDGGISQFKNIRFWQLKSIR
jgi:fructan beta-fructosidase